MCLPNITLCFADRPCPMDCPTTEEASGARGLRGCFQGTCSFRIDHTRAALVWGDMTRPACTFAPKLWTSAGMTLLQFHSFADRHQPLAGPGQGLLKGGCRMVQSYPDPLSSCGPEKGGAEPRKDPGPQHQEGRRCSVPICLLPFGKRLHSGHSCIWFPDMFFWPVQQFVKI